MTDIDIYNAAAALGRKGGQSISEAKQAASRENGKLGGRPSEYVYGWYAYKDNRQIKFRYPSSRADDLKQDGKAVTVETTQGGNKWNKRRGIVVWGGGNYTVTPR